MIKCRTRFFQANAQAINKKENEAFLVSFCDQVSSAAPSSRYILITAYHRKDSRERKFLTLMSAISF